MWSLTEVLAYDGVSKDRRDWLKRPAERVKATYAHAIVVYHLDRFARDLAATLDHPAAADHVQFNPAAREPTEVVTPPLGSS